MSSDVIARVQALFRKAKELELRGHLLRAAEYHGRCAEAARALGPDNLVVWEMQRCQAGGLYNYTVSAAKSNAAVDPDVLAAHRAECVALFATVIAALERRRVAGTLLEGKCSAAEEAWSAAMLSGVGCPADEVAWRAPLVGSDLFLNAANLVLGLLVNASLYRAECSASQFQAFAQHVANAADRIQQPRSHGTLITNAEAGLVQRIESAVSVWGDGGLDSRLVQLLNGAWQRLEQSGVLEARGIREAIQYGNRVPSDAVDDTFVSAVRAAMSAPGLRTCAMAGCGAKEAHPKHFKSCAACRAVVYCCRDHQVEGWPGHKKTCKAARKAAAAAEGAAS